MSRPPDAYPEPPSWLAGIPGYQGYHAKEQRRLADRALRDDLARRVATSVQQVQRLSAAAARARRFADLEPLDRLTARLLLFADRLRAVPEGYRGLFEQEQIDEAALDQVLAFDRALAAGVERLNALTAGLGEPAAGPALETPAGAELVELVEQLHRRLDARTTVMTEGRPLEPAAALAVLQPPARPEPPLTLKPGDAVSYGSADYIVDAAVAYRGDRAWQEYRLRDGGAERWLLVEPGAAYLLEAIPATAAVVEADGATAEGRRYGLVAQGQATATLTGPSGTRPNVPVSYRDYRDAAGAGLVVRDWGAERRILRGEAIDRALLTVFPRA